MPALSELIELARVVARSGGIYASHIRNEEDGLLEAIDEAIAIGKSAGVPVHISHLKANGKANWGKAALAVERIVAARERGQVVTGRPVSLCRFEHQARPDGGSPLGDPRRWRRVCPAGRNVRPRSPAPRRDPARARSPRGRSRHPDRPLSAHARAGSGATWSPSPATRGPRRWRSCSISSVTAARRRSASG